MITSKMFRSNHPSRVSVLMGDAHAQQTGLLTDSVVMTDNLATITVSAIERVIGTLSMLQMTLRSGTHSAYKDWY